MPELPEVEIIRQQLIPLVCGRTIGKITTVSNANLFLTPPSVLKRILPGLLLSTLKREGKFLIFELDKGYRLLLHLGMTGQLFVTGQAHPYRLSAKLTNAFRKSSGGYDFQPDRHTHLQMAFKDSGPPLIYRDIRKFGKIQLLKAEQPCQQLERLGVDVLVAKGDLLYSATRKRRIAIKTLLLDQSVLCGVGNIYADESLFMTGVRPSRRSHLLSRKQCQGIVTNLQTVMKQSIQAGGSSISDFINPNGSNGSFQKQHRVYGRSGQSCICCGSTIKRIIIGQRSSHYCPTCQH